MPRRRYDSVVGKCYVGNTNECMICRKYCTPSPTGIKLHLKIKHGITYSLAKHCSTCFACRKDFENYGALISHLKNEHY